MAAAVVIVLEDLVPFAEGEVARQQHTPAFVAFRQECEQDFHLLATLLHVGQVVGETNLRVGRAVHRVPVVAGARSILADRCGRRIARYR